jgi:hypothetical protein
MKDQDLYWLAGWLEGEGSFVAASTGRGGRYNPPSLDAVTTDEDTAFRVANILGAHASGPIRRKKAPYVKGEPKPIWHIRLRSWRAVAVMRKIYPLMSARRQAQIVRAIYSVGDYQGRSEFKRKLNRTHERIIVEMRSSGAGWAEISRALSGWVTAPAVIKCWRRLSAPSPEAHRTRGPDAA